MKRMTWLFGVLACASLSGCVERRFVIESLPPGAQVLRNGQSIGFTPADDSFVYYGKYDFTLIAAGYETLHVVQPVRAPWWEIPPLDFITENLIPFKIRDIRRFRYEMQPLQAVAPADVLQRGEGLRGQSQGLGDPRPVPVPPATAAPAVPPVTISPPGTAAPAATPMPPAP